MDHSPVPQGLSVASLGEALQVLRPGIPRALLDGPAWERVVACTRDLPAVAATDMFGFEYRLQQEAPDADLSLAVSFRSDVALHYIERGAAADADAAVSALGWFLREGRRDDSFLSRVFGSMVVEYDLSTGVQRTSPPGFYLMPPPCPVGGTARPAHVNPGLLTAVLAAAAGRTEDAGDRRAVENVFDALPATARVLHAGVFPGRDPWVIRLEIAGIEEAELPRMLERVDWPGSVDAAIGVLSDLPDRSPHVWIALGVTSDGIFPRLGLEFFQGPNWRSNKAGVWQRFIDRLVEKGWCLPGKAAGLRACTGAEHIFDKNRAFLARQGINHIKVSLQDSVVEAKAYVGAWLTPQD